MTKSKAEELAARLERIAPIEISGSEFSTLQEAGLYIREQAERIEGFDQREIEYEKQVTAACKHYMKYQAYNEALLKVYEAAKELKKSWRQDHYESYELFRLYHAMTAYEKGKPND